MRWHIRSTMRRGRAPGAVRRRDGRRRSGRIADAYRTARRPASSRAGAIVEPRRAPARFLPRRASTVCVSCGSSASAGRRVPIARRSRAPTGLAKPLPFSTPRARASLRRRTPRTRCSRSRRRPSGGFGARPARRRAHVGRLAVFRAAGRSALADALADRLRRAAAARSARRALVDELPRADVVLCRRRRRASCFASPATSCPAHVRPRASPLPATGWARSRSTGRSATPDSVAGGGVHGARAPSTSADYVGGDRASQNATQWEGRHGEAAVRAAHPAERCRRSVSRPRVRGNTRPGRYCHVPNPQSDVGHGCPRIEAQIERFAPGFRELRAGPQRDSAASRHRASQDANMAGGDIGAGVHRPPATVPRVRRGASSSRTERRCEGLYLCSSSTPPGGGVHGMCGYSAALVALRDS